MGNVGAPAVLTLPWDCHLCRLLTAIYHFCVTQPSPELQLFLPSCAGAARAEPFLSLSLDAVAAMLSSHSVCELKSQQWAALALQDTQCCCLDVLSPWPQDFSCAEGLVRPHMGSWSSCVGSAPQNYTVGASSKAQMAHSLKHCWGRGKLNPIHNVKGGSGTSGAALEVLAQANLLALAAHEEKTLNKQNTESCHWNGN